MWKDTPAGCARWHGIFEDQVDTKGNYALHKFEDGIEVPLSDGERARYIATRVEWTPLRFITCEELAARQEKVGQLPRALNDPTYGRRGRRTS